MEGIKNCDLIIQSFKDLKISYLEKLPFKKYYSNNTKEELIEELGEIFTSIKAQGVNKILVVKSKCKYCFPNLDTYSFYSPNQVFMARYVISYFEGEYIVQSCKNKIIKDGENGMPF